MNKQYRENNSEHSSLQLTVTDKNAVHKWHRDLQRSI